MITRQDLLHAKTRAIRLNIWFRALSKTERAIMDLTLKCVEQIRSRTLETVISSIIDRILEAFRSDLLSNAEKIGREMAERLGEIAKEWGHESASLWKFDKAFIRFLGINIVNHRQQFKEKNTI